jgi:hypothetical protein
MVLDIKDSSDVSLEARPETGETRHAVPSCRSVMLESNLHVGHNTYGIVLHYVDYPDLQLMKRLETSLQTWAI